MIKNFLVSLVVFCSFVVSFLSTQRETYIDYFHKINEAELFIVKDDYQSAFNVYKTTFKNYPHAFSKDIHNALMCAIRLRDANEAFEYAKMMVMQGYEFSFFDKESFGFLKNKKKMWKNFITEYPNIRKEYLKTIDVELREKYYSLFIEDQTVANPNAGYDRKQTDSIFYDLSIKVQSYRTDKK